MMEKLALICILVFVGASLAREPYDSSRLNARIGKWAAKAASELTKKVNEKSSNLQQVVEKAEKLQVERIAELYEENKNSLSLCTDTNGVDLTKASSCINITQDIANFTALCLFGFQLGEEIGEAVVTVMDDLNTCSTVSIWKELSCYEGAFKTIQTDIKDYSSDCTAFLQEADTVMEEFAVDIANCFLFAEQVPSETFEQKIKECKSKL